MNNLPEPEKSLIHSFIESKKGIDTIYGIFPIQSQKGKKSDKLIPLVCLIGKYRIYLLNCRKKKCEIFSELKFLSLKTVEWSDKEVTLFDKDNANVPLFSDSPDQIVQTIRKNLDACFPNSVAEILEWKCGSSRNPESGKSGNGNDDRSDKKAQNGNNDRGDRSDKKLGSLEKIGDFDGDVWEGSCCGNLGAAYMAMCDFSGTAYRPDVVWDIQNVIRHRSEKEFCFNTFLALSDKDIREILSALKYNHYFSILNIEGSDDSIPVEKEFSVLIDVFRYNRTISAVRFSSLKIDDKIWVAIFTSMQQNSASSVVSFEFNECPWESASKVLLSISANFHKNPPVSLTLKNTNFSKKSLPFFEALKKSPGSLQKLDLENCKFETVASDKLLEFLSETTNLAHLNVSNISISLPPLFTALNDKKTPMKFLNISGNKLQKKQTIQPILDYLMNCPLQNLDISNTEFSVSVIEKILTALLGNSHLENFSLSLNNNKLEKEGSEMLARTLVSNSIIQKLSLKSCELGDEGLRLVLKALENLQLQELDLSLNLKHPKIPFDKDREMTMNALADFLDFKGNRLSSLKISGVKGLEIGPHLDILFKRLSVGENVHLSNLDISGNYSGDDGALALGKFLERTKTLRHLSFDRNGTSPKGIQWLKLGISKNASLFTFETPISDLTTGGDAEKAKNILLWREIEELLRNRITTNFHKPPVVSPLPIHVIQEQKEEKSIKSPKHSKRAKLLESGVAKTPKLSQSSNPGSDRKVAPASPRNSGFAQNLNSLLAAPQSQGEKEKEKTKIVQIENSAIAVSAAPRLDNVRRAKGPQNRRPPKTGAIAGALVEEKKD